MMRRDFTPTASHRALQTMCMLLLLVGVGGVFVYPLMPPTQARQHSPNSSTRAAQFHWEPPFHDHDHVIIDRSSPNDVRTDWM